MLLPPFVLLSLAARAAAPSTSPWLAGAEQLGHHIRDQARHKDAIAPLCTAGAGCFYTVYTVATRAPWTADPDEVLEDLRSEVTDRERCLMAGASQLQHELIAALAGVKTVRVREAADSVAKVRADFRGATLSGMRVRQLLAERGQALPADAPVLRNLPPNVLVELTALDDAEGTVLVSVVYLPLVAVPGHVSFRPGAGSFDLGGLSQEDWTLHLSDFSCAALEGPRADLRVSTPGADGELRVQAPGLRVPLGVHVGFSVQADEEVYVALLTWHPEKGVVLLGPDPTGPQQPLPPGDQMEVGGATSDAEPTTLHLVVSRDPLDTRAGPLAWHGRQLSAEELESELAAWAAARPGRVRVESWVTPTS